MWNKVNTNDKGRKTMQSTAIPAIEEEEEMIQKLIRTLNTTEESSGEDSIISPSASLSLPSLRLLPPEEVMKWLRRTHGHQFETMERENGMDRVLETTARRMAARSMGRAITPTQALSCASPHTASLSCHLEKMASNVSKSFLFLLHSELSKRQTALGVGPSNAAAAAAVYEGVHVSLRQTQLSFSTATADTPLPDAINAGEKTQNLGDAALSVPIRLTIQLEVVLEEEEQQQNPFMERRIRKRRVLRFHTPAKMTVSMDDCSSENGRRSIDSVSIALLRVGELASCLQHGALAVARAARIVTLERQRRCPTKSWKRSCPTLEEETLSGTCAGNRESDIHWGESLDGRPKKRRNVRFAV